MAPLVLDPIDEIQLEAIAAELSFFLEQDMKSKRMVGFVLEKRRSGIARSAFELGPLAVWPRAVPAELVDRVAAGGGRRQRESAARCHLCGRRDRPRRR